MHIKSYLYVHPDRNEDIVFNDPARIDDPSMSLFEAVKKLSGGHPGSMKVLMDWIEKDRHAFLGILNSIDGKHLYDEHIWNVFKLCGEDLDRFIYHVEMELPDQLTGTPSISGMYCRGIDHEEFFAKRSFGKPGSYWALENPPTEADYSYPIS